VHRAIGSAFCNRRQWASTYIVAWGFGSIARFMRTSGKDKTKPIQDFWMGTYSVAFAWKYRILQAYLYSQMYLLSRFLRDKLCAIIDKHQELILNVYDHVYFAVSIRILELSGNRC
jgi:hypothetical protein